MEDFRSCQCTRKQRQVKCTVKTQVEVPKGKLLGQVLGCAREHGARTQCVTATSEIIRGQV